MSSRGANLCGHLWVDGLPTTYPHPTKLLSWFQEDHVQLNGHTCTLIAIRVRGQEGELEHVQSGADQKHRWAPLRCPSCRVRLWAGARVPGGQRDKE